MKVSTPTSCNAPLQHRKKDVTNAAEVAAEVDSPTNGWGRPDYVGPILRRCNTSVGPFPWEVCLASRDFEYLTLAASSIIHHSHPSAPWALGLLILFTQTVVGLRCVASRYLVRLFSGGWRAENRRHVFWVMTYCVIVP